MILVNTLQLVGLKRLGRRRSFGSLSPQAAPALGRLFPEIPAHNLGSAGLVCGHRLQQIEGSTNRSGATGSPRVQVPMICQTLEAVVLNERSLGESSDLNSASFSAREQNPVRMWLHAAFSGLRWIGESFMSLLLALKRNRGETPAQSVWCDAEGPCKLVAYMHSGIALGCIDAIWYIMNFLVYIVFFFSRFLLQRPVRTRCHESRHFQVQCCSCTFGAAFL